VVHLTLDDFELYEDGDAADDRLEVLVHAAGVESHTAAPAAPHGGSSFRPPGRPHAASGRIFVLFIDDLATWTSRTTGRVRGTAQEASRDTLIHQGDMFGIVSSGTSSTPST